MCRFQGSLERETSDLFSLRFGGMARTAECMTVGLVIVLSSAMQRNDVVHFVRSREHLTARVTPPTLACTHDSALVGRKSASGRHFVRVPEGCTKKNGDSDGYTHAVV